MTHEDPPINIQQSVRNFGLSMSYVDALAFAADAHAGQLKKGTDIPYISHPIAVSALVLEFGGSEEQAIVGLLHDVVEDCDQKYSDAILSIFGPKITSMVFTLSETKVDADGKKYPWIDRKNAYIKRLKSANPDVLLVAACDKLHCVTCLTRDVRRDGIETFSRFNASIEEMLWLYKEVADSTKTTPAYAALTCAIYSLEYAINHQD